VRFSVESWSPDYGVAVDTDLLEDASDRVDATVERALTDWAPIVPSATTGPDQVMFVDGVRRIDARIWVHGAGRVHAALCASVAAGVVTCRDERAVVSDALVRRFLVAQAASGASSVVTAHARYDLAAAVGDDPNAAYFAIHREMTALEHSLAASHQCDLVVFDGPLRGRNDPCGVGYVKTQHVQYLPEEVVPVLSRLGDGERTPLLLIGHGQNLARWSWYLRLPGPRSQPLSGVVRCELPGTGGAGEAVARADVVSTVLPRFASAAHKESRAPQNLYPISGLEHRLRHLLGDQLLLERALRRAAAASAAGPAPTGAS
jgi:hypothetical protein